MKLSKPVLFLLLLAISLNLSAQHKGMKLVWSDEFNYKGLPDSAKWSYDVGGNGWGNEERQYYTDHQLKNARV